MGAPYNTLKKCYKNKYIKKKFKILLKKLNQKQENKYTVLSWKSWIL
jgi:hypothetical protein